MLNFQKINYNGGLMPYSPIVFHNTLSGKIEEFIPINKNEVKMYTCGPTVYNYAHIGNFRAYIFEDLLRRFLKLAGFKVIQVMNITDIDDKTIKNANEHKKSLKEYTEFYIKAFFEDLDSLNIERAEFYPRATEHIDDMILLLKKLEKNNLTYIKKGSLYYKIKAFKDYGKLSKIDISNVKSGVRYDADEYEKDDVRDFVLWKAKKENEPFWESPYGEGRPGWHLECSAMSMKYLGETFDIHTGGVDNIFPHHENEIAQSEGATNKKFVNYWLHCEHLIVEGKKMSKSLGNFYTIRDLINKGYSPLAIRYLLLTSHYRSKLNFTFKGLKQAEKEVKKINDFFKRLNEFSPKENEISINFDDFKYKFIKALADDLNISSAMAVFYNYMHKINEKMTNYALSKIEKEKAIESLKYFDKIIGILNYKKEDIPENIKKLAEKRWEAKKQKDFKTADILRNEIFNAGFIIEDTKENYRIKKR